MKHLIMPQNYDYYIVSFSGGKDSLACVLHLIDTGIPRDRIELWHQCVDGLDTRENLFDWACTEDYCRKVAAYLGVRIKYQGRNYGIYGEIMRENRRSYHIVYEDDSGELITLPNDRSKINTRLKFPAKQADLRKRWCSGYVKIDVAKRALNHEEKYIGKRILFITGERREESAQRARYNEHEDHPCHSKKKTVHHWRPVIDWKEQEVWKIIQRYGIVPHPAYELGFPRLSCCCCIFFSPIHWYLFKVYCPNKWKRLVRLEVALNFTINNKKTLPDTVRGLHVELPEFWWNYTERANARLYRQPIHTDTWTLPAGAFNAFGTGGGSL